MNVDGAQAGHIPHRFGQHPESYHYLQIGGVALQFSLKIGRFKVGGLQHGQAVGSGGHLHRRGLQLPAAPGRSVGSRNNGHHLPTRPGQQVFEGGHGKIGGAHEYDFQH